MSYAALTPRTAGVASVIFEVSADLVRNWRDARRSGGARWHEHDVHLQKPRSEFLGPGVDDVTFSMRLDAGRGVVPRDELRQLRRLRDTGEVLQFTVGGELVGDYTLRSLTEEWTRLDARGVLVIAEVAVTLKEYV